MQMQLPRHPRPVVGMTCAGKKRRWDVVQSHSSVGIVVFHKELKALVLVRQFRPAVRALLASAFHARCVRSWVTSIADDASEMKTFWMWPHVASLMCTSTVRDGALSAAGVQ